jgi:hypothetical protein
MATDRSLPPRIARARDGVDDVVSAVRTLANEVAALKPPHMWVGKSHDSHERALNSGAGDVRDATANLRATVSGLDDYRDEILRRIAAEDRALERARLQREAEKYAREHGNPFLPDW